MDTAVKMVGCLYIFSTLSMGCYSSATIDAVGEEKEKVYTYNIRMVTTKDGAKYEFSPPAMAVSDTVKGTIKGEQVEIPLNRVTKMHVSRKDIVATVLVIGVGAVLAVGLIFKPYDVPLIH